MAFFGLGALGRAAFAFRLAAAFARSLEGLLKILLNLEGLLKFPLLKCLLDTDGLLKFESNSDLLNLEILGLSMEITFQGYRNRTDVGIFARRRRKKWVF